MFGQRAAMPTNQPVMTLVPSDGNIVKQVIDRAKTSVFDILVNEIDFAELNKLENNDVQPAIKKAIEDIILAQNIVLSGREQEALITEICDDMFGLGPLEPLLQDDTVTEIMVNGAKSVFVERNGLIERTNVTFKDESKLMNLCSRIANEIGRRIDESNPMVDARLADGSRVNIIVPPLSHSASLTIRKFKKQTMSIDSLTAMGGMSEECATVLKAAAANKVNILISGGTGSGKTTLLNALSEHIDNSERLITIEDTFELQLKQTNVVSLETRDANLEGVGAVSQRELLKNALRMRPDRIILGEVRGEEAFDMLQAMNTGHEGSMGTVHANNPRDAMVRLENMISMGNFGLSSGSIRQQIASAIGMIVQVSRLKDGSRRVTNVSEITGMEGDIILMHDLFTFECAGEDDSGKVIGELCGSGFRPHFTNKATYFGHDNESLTALNIGHEQAEQGGGNSNDLLC